MTHSILSTETASFDITPLRSLLTGDFVVPGGPDWDTARGAWNLAVDQRPAAVVLAESAADVATVVDFAREAGLRVAPQGTGHSAAPLGSLEDTILLKTERMRRIEIDPEVRSARVEAGVLWADVAAAAAEHGLAALAGSSPDVGVVGYTVGGGMSWLSRRYGLAANSVLAAEVVTADGRIVRADRDNEPDLFWAVRGGGGSFGIVTALEFQLYPVTEVCAGWLVWPLERAAAVLYAWREWTRTVPDEMTSVGRLLRVPPLPDIPEPFRGRSFVVVEGVYLGAEDDAAKLLAPLRALAPEMDTFATMPVQDLHHLHMDPEQPVPGAADGMLLEDFPPEAVDSLLEVAGAGATSPLISVEIRHLEGALADPKPTHGALASIDAAFAVFAVGIAPSPEARAAVHTHIEFVRGALAPWSEGREYLNFSERPTDGRSFYREQAYRRLRRIKAHYDPVEVIRSNHPIPPAS